MAKHVSVSQRVREEHGRPRAKEFCEEADKRTPRGWLIVGDVIDGDAHWRAFGGTQEGLGYVLHMYKTHGDATRPGAWTEAPCEPCCQLAEKAAFPSVHFANSQDNNAAIRLAFGHLNKKAFDG